VGEPDGRGYAAEHRFQTCRQHAVRRPVGSDHDRRVKNNTSVTRKEMHCTVVVVVVVVVDALFFAGATSPPFIGIGVVPDHRRPRPQQT